MSSGNRALYSLFSAVVFIAVLFVPIGGEYFGWGGYLNIEDHSVRVSLYLLVFVMSLYSFDVISWKMPSYRTQGRFLPILTYGCATGTDIVLLYLVVFGPIAIVIVVGRYSVPLGITSVIRYFWFTHGSLYSSTARYLLVTVLMGYTVLILVNYHWSM